ncbi:MAG: molybdopterin molybdenumtransferase MoeA, partial [Anaerolineae bacterium]
LPGNPVSTLVGFEMEIRPVLRAMAHRTARWRPERLVRLEHAVRHEATRLEFQRARIEFREGAWWARTMGSQASSRLLSLVGANALLRIPVGTGDLPAAAMVSAILIDEPETEIAP